MILTQGGYNNVIYTDDMPNKHIDHLEDIIFSGRRKALAAVNDVMNKPHISVKWDGAPAIVFGTNPENDQFFGGTKSVFNKRKVKICYSYSDIDELYKGDVADILRLCFRHLPRIGGIVQADWIGVGGGRIYRPNVVEYRFPTQVSGHILLAPHTTYTEVSPDAVGVGNINLGSESGATFLNNNDCSAFIVDLPNFRWRDFILETMKSLVPSEKARPYIQKHINKYIREGHIPSAKILLRTLPDKYKGEVNLSTFKVWHMISQLKQSLLDNIVVNGDIETYIDGKPSQHEGFVVQGETPYKLVDRLTFSKANFNLSKYWTNEKV